MAMPLKHIAFNSIPASDRDAWIKSQARWLELSVTSGGLASAWASLDGDQARAVFEWESDDALRGFMETTHERALADAGTVGRSAVLYLSPVMEILPRDVQATFVGESIAWLKEGGDDVWLESQRMWSSAMRECDGFGGGLVARGRRTYLTTSFWRDRAAHDRFMRDVVPGVRGRTSDEQVARLSRFAGDLIQNLCR